MGIKITNKKSNLPKALKLMSSIKSYLFEEEFGECKLMKTSEIEALQKAVKALGRTSDRTCK